VLGVNSKHTKIILIIFLFKFLTNGRRQEMKKGKIIIDYRSNNGNCDWRVSQEGPNELDNENLVFLLENVIGDLIADQFEEFRLICK
jgi:hypothetical protein